MFLAIVILSVRVNGMRSSASNEKWPVRALSHHKVNTLDILGKLDNLNRLSQALDSLACRYPSIEHELHQEISKILDSLNEQEVPFRYNDDTQKWELTDEEDILLTEEVYRMRGLN